MIHAKLKEPTFKEFILFFFQNWGMGIYCPAYGALVAVISLAGAYLLKH